MVDFTMRRNHFLLLAIAAVLLAAGCAHDNQTDNPLAPVYRDPLRADGQLFEATIYPYDYAQDPNRYVMCLRPCSLEQASEDLSVIVPLVPGAFDGARGTQAYTVRVVFRAVCFHPNSACPHRPFIFQQVE